MSTGIPFTDEAWGVTAGCSKAGRDCANCWAIRDARRMGKNPNPKIASVYGGLVERNGDGLNWTGEVRLAPERLDRPRRWKKPRRVFVDPMGDLFHPNVPDRFIREVFGVMHDADHHTYQILTKRPKRMFELLCAWGWWARGPYPHVHLGVSIGDHRTAVERLEFLANCPAAVRIISYEPAIGAVDWRRWTRDYHDAFHQVIFGGESASPRCKARPLHPVWALDALRACRCAGWGAWFKQWGEWAPRGPQYAVNGGDGRAGQVPPLQGASKKTIVLKIDGAIIEPLFERPPDPALKPWMMELVGKRAAGRSLAGRTYSEEPKARLSI